MFGLKGGELSSLDVQGIIANSIIVICFVLSDEKIWEER